MQTPTIESLFESVSKKMITDFEAAKSDIPHYGERGEELERVLINWLSNFLPKRFSAGTGFVLGVRNEISPQTDVIIYDAYNSPILKYTDKTLILPADNVAIAIEVKSNLNKQAFEDAVQKASIIKSISKTPITEFDLLSEGAKKITQRQTYCILFAYESDSSLETIRKWYIDKFENGRHLDFVCVLNKGWIDLIVSVAGTAEYSPVLSPEALAKPKSFKSELILFAGSHQESDHILYFMVRNILGHLQVFRSQMFIPMFMANSNVPTLTDLQQIGTVPSLDEDDQVEPVKLLKKLE